MYLNMYQCAAETVAVARSREIASWQYDALTGMLDADVSAFPEVIHGLHSNQTFIGSVRPVARTPH
jgi:hypothetical protein